MSGLHSHTDVAVLLAQNLGIEKATELVVEACVILGLPDQLSREQGLAVLEKLTEQPGLVGISARFAKSRAILRWGN